jgi:hypothetical protein
MPPEPGYLGRLIDERSGRRTAARSRLGARLRSFGYWLSDLEAHGYSSKYVAEVARDIHRRIKKRKRMLEHTVAKRNTLQFEVDRGSE